MKKILYCYWMQYNDTNNRGGGVQVYLKNIITKLNAVRDIKIYTLSSGVAYNFGASCHIEKIKNNSNIDQYQIVNSPMLAPSKSSFYMQNIYLNDERLKNTIRGFLTKIGGVDVIHFQSFEGLTLKILELKQEFPHIKFIVSVHNYQYFCPQANLWKNDSISCDDFHGGNDCLHCLGRYPGTKQFKQYYIFDYYFRKAGLGIYSKSILNYIKLFYNKLKTGQRRYENAKIPINYNHFCNANTFMQFREKNIQYINRYVDLVLCVSEQVRRIAINFGIDSGKVITNYIGTQFAEGQATESKFKYSAGDTLKVAYMGYMRKDKGFYFFLEALERMEISLARKISVVIAARYDDLNAVKRIEKLKNKFESIALYNGCTHKQIPEIVDGVHLGIVPVLWEDNLPQVAIEFKAMGIAVMASDKGGASELSRSGAFEFKAGDYIDFIEKLENIIHHPEIIHDYWSKQLRLTAMDEHCRQLMQFYEESYI